MALQLRYQVQLNNWTFPYAYARLDGAELSNSSAMATLQIYAGRAARELGHPPLDHVEIELTQEEVASLYKQMLASMYRILRDRPEYRGLAEV